MIPKEVPEWERLAFGTLFTQDDKHALIARGYDFFHLLDDRNNPKGRGLFEVAINTNQILLPNSNNKNFEKQKMMIAEYSDSISREIPGVKAILGTAYDYAALAGEYFKRTKKSLIEVDRSQLDWPWTPGIRTSSIHEEHYERNLSGIPDLESIWTIHKVYVVLFRCQTHSDDSLGVEFIEKADEGEFGHRNTYVIPLIVPASTRTLIKHRFR